tara:strand:- start:282 stop:926 length:645 start_codon:yes stop_codon:yes gene_type:complete
MKTIRIAVRERRALNCFVSGDYQRARAHFRAIERIDPAHPGINHNLALVAMAQGEYAEAETRLLDELERLGDYYPRLRVLADTYYAWGKRIDARTFYRRALAQEEAARAHALIEERIAICDDPRRFDDACTSVSRHREGVDLEGAGRTDAAIEAYREAIALDPTNIPALNNLGALLMNARGEFDAAADLFSRALEWEPAEWIAENLEKARRGRR